MKEHEWLSARRHSFSACTNASKDAEGSKQNNQNRYQIFDDNAEEDVDDGSIVSIDVEEVSKKTQECRKSKKCNVIIT